jgi:polysaccharide export outer membrane protein
MSSCITRKKMTYLESSGMPDKQELSISATSLPVTPAEYKIKPYDNLYIRVITPDPQWSALFNPSAFGQGGSMTQESASLVGYPVDSKGLIEIPFVGKISVGGLSLAEIKVQLDSIFINYLNNAAITVRLVNNYVSVLGEVQQPGRYALGKDRVNIFEVVAMAGDMNVFSNRQEIKLIRQSEYGPIIKEFSLLDKNILLSEYYYIMPNDIIYVKPLRGKSMGVNSSAFQVLLGSFTAILSTITTLFVIFNFNSPAN